MINYEEGLMKTPIYKKLYKLGNKYGFKLKRVVKTPSKTLYSKTTGKVDNPNILVVYENTDFDGLEVILETNKSRLNPVYISNIPFNGKINSFGKEQKMELSYIEADVLKDLITYACNLAEELDTLFLNKELEQIPYLDERYATEEF